MTYNTNYRESRLLTAAGAVLLTAYAVWQTVLFLRSPGEYVLFGTLIVSSGTAAAMCWWFALRGHVAESRAVLRVGCLSGVVVGVWPFWPGSLVPSF